MLLLLAVIVASKPFDYTTFDRHTIIFSSKTFYRVVAGELAFRQERERQEKKEERGDRFTLFNLCER